MLRIKVFSDYICPFCHIGDGILEILAKEYEMTVERVGMEIHPETPDEGVQLDVRFGKDRLAISLEYLQNISRTHGIPFNPIYHMPNSHNALEAAEFARDHQAHEQFHKAIMHAYFVDGKDIGNIEILKEIAESVGLNVESMVKALEIRHYEDRLSSDLRMARQLGIHSTPTFVINDAFVITGAQPLENFKSAFDEILQSEVDQK